MLRFANSIVKTVIWLSILLSINTSKKKDSKDIVPLTTISEDIYDLKIYLDRKSTYTVNLMNRMDLTSISSNFSTNIKDLIPPGVVGRYKPQEYIFPDIEFNPQKMVNVRGNFIILSKDRKTTFLFSYSEEKGYHIKNFIFDQERYFYQYIECTDVESQEENAIFLCYNINTYNNQMSGIKTQYYIFVINLSNNKIIMGENFESQRIENPRLKIGRIAERENNFVFIIYPQLTKTLNRQRLKFQPKSRMIMLRIKKLINKFNANEKWKLMEDFVINVENEVEQTNRENVSLISFDIRRNGAIILHYGSIIFLILIIRTT